MCTLVLKARWRVGSHRAYKGWILPCRCANSEGPLNAAHCGHVTPSAALTQLRGHQALRCLPMLQPPSPQNLEPNKPLFFVSFPVCLFCDSSRSTHRQGYFPATGTQALSLWPLQVTSTPFLVALGWHGWGGTGRWAWSKPHEEGMSVHGPPGLVSLAVLWCGRWEPSGAPTMTQGPHWGSVGSQLPVLKLARGWHWVFHPEVLWPGPVCWQWPET